MSHPAATAVVAAVVVLSVVGGAIVYDDPGTVPGIDTADHPDRILDEESAAGLVQFGSADAFRSYLEQSRSRGVARPGRPDVVREAPADGDERTRRSEDGGADGGVDRISDTNVQERGVDEPDVLKHRGTSVFYAPRSRYDESRSAAVLDVSSPAEPERIGTVPRGGRMLVSGETLVVLGDGAVTGYDVTTPGSPTETWSRDLDGRIAAARLVDGVVFLLVRSGVDRDDPCPVEPLEGVSIDCGDVYRPARDAGGDATYTMMTLRPDDGGVEDSVSVVASHRRTVTYVSGSAAYLAYSASPSRSTVQLEFFLDERPGLLDGAAKTRLRELQSYNLSERALRYEIDAVVDEWAARQDDPEDARTRLREAFRSYRNEHKRSLERTGIATVRLGGDGLSIAAVGSVPGTPLNQFSMDAHEGHLRIATTVSAGESSENDLYVLDGSLDRVGAVQGMGIDERIYSVRFMEEEAYVVTFRRIDPFHVIDLSDQDEPTLEGELKLPGFSSYLHPLGNDTVLGIGEEDGHVKAVLFDVSDPTDPTVRDSKIFDERWSAIEESHHAFLQDERHGVFFLPTGSGGYVVDYEDGLDVETKVSTPGPARRAMYVDDYLYVFADDELVVVDETDWSREGVVALTPERRGADHDLR